MKKNVVKINESQLRRIIAESIEQALGSETNEDYEFERLWEEFEDWMDSYNQSDYPTSYTNKDIARHFYELGLKNRALNEEGGYDMSTPEGREGARKWMNSMMSQEDPTGGYADQWVSNNAPDYPDISWDDCYEHMKRAFIAGVEYGRELN